MRLLLIAYEFPPSPSPQSLRWVYLIRELAALGHEIHVLAPDLGGEAPGLPQLPASVIVHRCFAGPFRGLMAVRRKRRQRLAANRAGDTSPGQAGLTVLRPPRNWKQRVSETVQAGLEYALFPDLRGEWKPWATRALDRVLQAVRPDAVISSHEPATSLELGLRAKAAGYRWIADLGDPVLAGYTPARWRRRAAHVERATCLGADLITVTNPATAELLRARHGRPNAVEVLPQGFDARPTTAAGLPDIFDAERLELLYTGSLYRFRRIDALLAALRTQARARLNIAAITVPEHILELARAASGQVRLLGFLPHAAILQLQRRADVLVNIANEDVTQIPGKFYEYLGAQRPVLHIEAQDDPISDLVRDLRRGWVCGNDEASLSPLLSLLASAHAREALDDGLQLGLEPVQRYSWQAIAERLEHRLQELRG